MFTSKKLFLSPLLSILWVLSLVIQTVHAAPTDDPCTGDMPTFESKAEEGTDYNTGDWGVAEQNGAVTYTYPVSLPTGRNGMKPSLVLRYSSTSGLRGGLAVGWSMDVPSIRVDNTLGVESSPIYRASLRGASGRLVKVEDGTTLPNTPFRIDFDDSFTRFFLFNTGFSPATWQAWTADGVIHEFGTSTSAGDNRNLWMITQQKDNFGNTVKYFWAKTDYGYFDSYDLTRIEYAANEMAGLVAYAKIDFVYNADLRCDGAPMPVGAAPMVSNILSGARQLNALKISVRDAPNGGWRVSREVNLIYALHSSTLFGDGRPIRVMTDSPTTNAAPQSSYTIDCNGQAALRYLKQIQETGIAPDGVSTTLPPLTFDYNYRIKGPGVGLQLSPTPGLTNPLTRTVTSPGYALAGNSSTGILTSLIDIDSDGIDDRVSVTKENERCVLAWHRGQWNGAFETTARKSPLPTLPWYYQSEHQPNEIDEFEIKEREKCTLTGQKTFRDANVPSNGNQPHPGWMPTEQILQYKFVDFTGDGRIDLVTTKTGSLEFEESQFAPPFRETIPWIHSNVFLNVRESPGFSPNSEFSVFPNPVDSPVPFGGTATESRVDDVISLKGMPFAIFDLDGDGFLDAIEPNLPTNDEPFWTVHFGNGKTSDTFGEGYQWAIPQSENSSHGLSGRIRRATEDGNSDTVHDRRTEISTLRDIDGDGLADLVRQEKNQSNQLRLRVYRNTGRGFAFQPIDLGIMEPVELLQADYRYSNRFIDDGHRGYRQRLLDLDSDGLVDLVYFKDDPARTSDDDIVSEQKIYARFNLGGYFSSTLQELPTYWRAAKRLFSAEQGNWWIENDFYDATGDGLSDLVTFTSDGRKMQVIERPGLPAAPDLLRAVDNGRGLRLEFTYTASTAATAVQWDAKNFKLNHAKWVVSEIRKIDKFSTSPHTTRYSYQNPVSYVTKANAAYREPGYFVGFATVTRTEYDSASTPLNRVVHGYGYETVPDGALETERLFRAENGEFKPHSFTNHAWKVVPLFGGKLSFAYSHLSLTRTCLPGASESACATQSENIFRSQNEWTGVSAGANIVCHREAGATQSAILYVPTLSQSGSSPSLGELDRRTKQCFQIRYDLPNSATKEYRILPTESVREVVVFDQNGLRFETNGKSKTYYTEDFGVPYQIDTWLDAETVATTQVSYDSLTGNLSNTTKPEQVAAGALAKRTNYTYDAHRLFVQNTTNELGHSIITTHDLATGALLERRGPNFVRIANNQKDWERETWRIDGFGRVLEHAISLDAADNHYVLETIAKSSYFDNELPNRVRSLQLLDIGGSRWITAEQQLSGVGQVLTSTQFLDGNMTAITTYGYDSAGNLTTTQIPDPRTDDGARVRYTYAYDGLGRLTQFTRPDQNGITISYAGLEKTIAEVTTDDSGGSKKEVYDILGRLVELHEFGATPQPAITRYEYDGNDNLRQIIDAEENQTQMAHDWQGHRVAVTRGERTWRYFYDRNGNLHTRLAPVPAGTDPQRYTTSYQHDALDRVTQVTFPDQQIISLTAQLSTTVSATTSTPITTTLHYTYDVGRNGIGRLGAVELPYANVQYSYEARGLPVREERSFALSDVATASASQWVQRQYNALGQPTLSQWDDGQQWQINYDGRGLVDQVQWFDPQSQSWTAVADFDRSVLGLPRTRNSAFGQIRYYTYDDLARPAQENVTVNGNAVASRNYTYNGSGDLTHVTGDTAGVSAEARYSYDRQHRLTNASAANGYVGTFTYSATGNLLSANVTWNGSSESRNVRYEYGDDDPQAVDRLIDQTTNAIYADFDYDLAGNMQQRNTLTGDMALLWDGRDQLRMVEGANGTEVYFYDENGMRMLAVSAAEGVRFWFGERETHYDLTGIQNKRYLHLSAGGATIARVEDGNQLELQYADALQNLMFSLDKAGNVLASFLYGPFGEVVQATGAEDHRRQFNGKENDVVTGLRYYGYRYYDPLALRWNSSDPLYRILPEIGMDEPQRMNLFSFSLNNPIRYYDADGREAVHDPGPGPFDDSTICSFSVQACPDKPIIVGGPLNNNDEETAKKPQSDQSTSSQPVFNDILSSTLYIFQVNNKQQRGDGLARAVKVKRDSGKEGLSEKANGASRLDEPGLRDHESSPGTWGTSLLGGEAGDHRGKVRERIRSRD